MEALSTEEEWVEGILGEGGVWLMPGQDLVGVVEGWLGGAGGPMATP